MMRELEDWKPPKTITDTKSRQKYKVGMLLGKGSFGTCYKVTTDCYEIVTSRVRSGCEASQEKACKIVKKSPPLGMLETDWTQKIKREIYIHSSLSHENIARFLSHVQDEVNHYLLLELCANKSLSEMQKRRGTITELEARYYMKQIISGVRYLQDRNIIHRDLKPGNIFIHKTMTIKIGDFGLATRAKGSFDKRRTMCGTRNYVAPEMLNSQGHGLEVDIWAIGCILYNFLVGRPPFSSQATTPFRRVQVVFPHQVSNDAQKLISELLQTDPNLRPTPIEIINSDFIKCGPTIPTTLPESALTTEPRFDIENELPPTMSMSPALGLGLGNLVGVQNRSGYHPRHYTTEQIEALPSLMKYLQEDIKNALGSKLHPSSDKGTESPKSVPLLWIVKWWAWWEKEFGFAYQLSDGSAGMSFNDNSRMMLLNDDVTLQYVDIEANREVCYTHTVFPDELGKKVLVFNKCLQHMNQKLAPAAGRMGQDPNVSLMTRLPSIHKWFHSTQSTVMLLTNGTLQINNRVNHKKMILCPHLRTITVLNRSGASGPVMETFKLSKIEKKGCTLKLRQDLQYSLEKVEVLLRLHLPQNLLAQG